MIYENTFESFNRFKPYKSHSIYNINNNIHEKLINFNNYLIITSIKN